MVSGTRGFTLPELIIVMVITGIIAAVIAVFIVRPVDAYLDQSRRAELVDAAEMSLQRMARDIRRALPNSVRTDGTTLEFLSIRDAARYRAGPGASPVGGDRDRRLEFDRLDEQFNIQSPGPPDIRSGDRLAIYNLGQPGADAYAGDPVITPAGMSITVADDVDVPGEHRVTMNGGHRFALESPRQRVFVVEGAVAYRCEPALSGGLIRRMQGYAFGPGLPGDFSGAAVASSHVSACSFSYDPGTATRNAVVTLRVQVTMDGETVSLTRQVHVENSP
jgi:MSHA biogenesis protein MshO